MTSTKPFGAATNLRTLDALQAATAIHAQATALITNDSIFARVPEFESLILEELL